MVGLSRGGRRRSALVAVVFSIGLLAGIGQSPAYADVATVSGSAFGYSMSVAFDFGGGPGPAQVSGPAPNVTLPSTGGSETASVPSASAAAGPAVFFESGPISVSTEGTTGPGGSSTSSVSITGTGGGVDPFYFSTVDSTCSSNETSTTASTVLTGAFLNLGNGEFVELPESPLPNTEYFGTIDGVGDRFRIVLNEQVVTSDSITVNAMHMYLLGFTANGEVIVGQSHCDIVADAATTPTTLTCTVGVTRSGQPIDICTVADPDGIRTVQVKKTATNTQQAGLAFDCAEAPTTARFRVPANTRYKVVVSDCNTPRHKTTFTIRANGAVNRVSPPEVGISNRAPVAADDAFVTVIDTVLEVPAPGVLANDTDLDGDPLAAQMASHPTVSSYPVNGTLTFNAEGSFSYVPDPGFAGTDTFTYLVRDPRGGSDTATVTITVANPPNTGPPNNYFADAEVITGASGSVTGTTVGANEESGEPDHGAVSIWYRWTAPADGQVTFNTCQSRSEVTTENGGWLDTVLAVYTGASIRELTEMASSGDDEAEWCGGGRDFPAGSRVTFMATAGTVYHIAVDGTSRFSDLPDVGTVVLEWKMATGNEPVAVDDYIIIANTTVNPAGSVDVLANDYDPNGDAITFTSNTAGLSRGDLVCTSTGVCTYTTRPGFDDRRFTEIFKYTVTDSNGDTAVGTVSVAVNLPVPVDDAYSAIMNTPLTVAAPGVLSNDGTDTIGDPFTAGVASDPANGSVVLNPDGSFTYTPDAGFTGTDTFTYHAFDLQSRPSALPATVTLTVTPA